MNAFDGFCIVRSHPNLITYVDSLQRKNAEALSFYPTITFEREAARGRIFLGLLNGEPCGYIYMGALGGEVRCHQVCIQYDARRRLYGAALVVAIEDEARKFTSRSVRLRCGFDLDANEFWRGLGYSCIHTVPGGIRRMRQINIWRKTLQPGLWADEHIEPAVGKTSASIWSKHKQTGIVTQFVRGKGLQDYRASIISASAKASEQ